MFCSCVNLAFEPFDFLLFFPGQWVFFNSVWAEVYITLFVASEWTQHDTQPSGTHRHTRLVNLFHSECTCVDEHDNVTTDTCICLCFVGYFWLRVCVNALVCVCVWVNCTPIFPCIISPNKQLLRLASRFHLSASRRRAANSHLKRLNSLKPFKAAAHWVPPYRITVFNTLKRKHVSTSNPDKEVSCWDITYVFNKAPPRRGLGCAATPNSKSYFIIISTSAHPFGSFFSLCLLCSFKSLPKCEMGHTWREGHRGSREI